MYYGNKGSDLIKAVMINWDCERDLMEANLEKQVRKAFDDKTDFLIDYISRNIGKLIGRENKEGFIKRTWETSSGISLYLSYNRKRYNVELTIHEK